MPQAPESQHRSPRGFVVLALVLAGCGAAPHGTADGSLAGSDAADAGWTPLISRTWSLGAGLETYKCRRIQVPSEMWVGGFRAMSPTGTHHEVLTISTTSTPVGDYDCVAGNLDVKMLYAAGVNTDDLVFPAGMAVHLPAGTYINLNLHLFNATDNELDQESGVLVKTVEATQVSHEIEMTFSGNMHFSIPAHQTATIQGGCAAIQDYHVFALWPHMHQIATHQSFTVTHSGTPTKLLDADYQFTEQRNYPLAETIIQNGDQITTACTYNNTTDNTITFGDSSTEEMCFTGIYKYPAGDNLFSCVTML
jgi:hypothetical protein